MKKYKQLTLGLRYQIFAYKQENYSLSKIAELIGVNKSTVITIYINKTKKKNDPKKSVKREKG